MNRYKYIDEKGEHLHTLDGKPLIGTSTATKIIAKPLTWWASGKAMEVFGWKNKKLSNEEERMRHAQTFLHDLREMTIEEYLKKLDDGYSAHSKTLKKAGEDGSDVHEALEVFVKNCLKNDEGRPHLADNRSDIPEVRLFAEYAVQNISKFLWSEIHCYSEELWTGGIADVGWIDKQERIIAGDFKSGGPYFDQFVQIGGYDLELSENGGFTADGDKIFSLPSPIQGYCVLPFKAKKFEPCFEYDIEAYRNGFKYAVGLSKLSKQFDNK